MASAASEEKLLYNVKNFKTYFAKLKAKCMTSADAAQVLLGIFADPIREMEATNKAEHDKLVARLADLANNGIDSIDNGTVIPTEELFKQDPVKHSKLFVKVLNSTQDADATVKTATLKTTLDFTMKNCNYRWFNCELKMII